MQERRNWKINPVYFCLSSVHTLSVSSIPHFGMCDFGIPGITGYLSRKWQRDGCLRLAVQAHVTVCYGWAVGQSQGSKCSSGRSLTWLTLDRHWQGIQDEIFFPQTELELMDLFYWIIFLCFLFYLKKESYLCRCFKHFSSLGHLGHIHQLIRHLSDVFLNWTTARTCYKHRLSVSIFLPYYSFHCSVNPLALNRIFFFSGWRWGVGRVEWDLNEGSNVEESAHWGVCECTPRAQGKLHWEPADC